MLVVDTSGSMADPDGNGDIKIETARASLITLLRTLPGDADVGLRTYPGGASATDCGTGILRQTPGAATAKQVEADIRTISPAGDTPTAEALHQAVDDLIAAGYGGGTIMLLSDGMSTCASPCEAAQEIVAQGFDLQVRTAGFDIDDGGAEELRCIAEATDGTYTDVRDQGDLDDLVDSLSRPSLSVELDYDKEAIAEVGLGNGSVDIDAVVKNVGAIEAGAVTAQLRFDEIEAAPGVRSPYRVLGNLAPGAAGRTQRWTFDTGLLREDTTIRFSVIVRARDLVDDVSMSGEILVRRSVRPEDSGPLLRDRERIVVMGDSYSAGEGAHEYLEGTDTDANACHRSQKTYLASFDVQPEDILACSGAVSANISGRGAQAGQYGEAGQLDVLEERLESGPPVDAIVLTIGGNDVGFSTVAKACIVPKLVAAVYKPCNEQISGTDADAFVEAQFQGLAGSLVQTYEDINGVANDEDRVAERGPIPIIVLAYPRILPGAERRTCSSMTYRIKGVPIGLLAQDELDFVSSFITRLNGTIEGAVQVAQSGSKRGTDAMPIGYVSTVEDAFLPSSTVCDEENHANGLDDAEFWDELERLGDALVSNGAAAAVDALTPWPIPDISPAVNRYFQDRIADDAQALKRELNELFHPNESGYAAMTDSIIRWSRTDAAAKVESMVTDPAAAGPGTDGRPPPAESSTTVLVEGTRAEVNGNTRYTIVLEGFLPGSTVQVTIRSVETTLATLQADDEGTLRGEVTLPPELEPGQHRVVGYGIDPAGNGVARSIDVVASTPTNWWPWVLVAGAGAMMVVGLGLRTMAGRSPSSEREDARVSEG